MECTRGEEGEEEDVMMVDGGSGHGLNCTLRSTA